MQPALFSRSIFARLHEHENALLRAMSWQRGESRIPTAKIPVRYVRIPVELAQQWLDSLASLSVTLHMPVDPDDTKDIRVLRHELDYVFSTFEQTWQYTPPAAPLDQAWERLWREMGEQLQHAPVVSGIQESYPCEEFDSHTYDFEQAPLDPEL